MVALARYAVAAVLALALCVATASAAEPPRGTVLYAVHHEHHGMIGTQEVSFSRSGEDLVVDVENRVEVKILFITVYRFEAEVREIWRDGRMISYNGRIRDDGTDYDITAEAEGDKLIIEGPEGRVEAPGHVFPTHPWDLALTERSLLMDTNTGALLEVNVAEVGEEIIEAGGRAVRARKFVISGDLERELWYGPDGTWLQMRLEKRGAKVTVTLQ